MVEDTNNKSQACIEMKLEDIDAINKFTKQLKEIKDKMKANRQNQVTNNKKERNESLNGVLKPDVVRIHNMKHIQTKGIGMAKGLKN